MKPVTIEDVTLTSVFNRICYSEKMCSNVPATRFETMVLGIFPVILNHVGSYGGNLFFFNN